MNLIEGRVWKYGDHVNTDVLFPGKYTYTVTDPAEMAAVALQDLDPAFAGGVRPGDVVVGGSNFGCGSSREQAAFCLKYAGVGAVVARTFSRLYFRNCINAGLPAITLPDAPEKLVNGERITIDLAAGTLICRAGTLRFAPLSQDIIEIFVDGGLIAHTRRKLSGADGVEPYNH